MANVKSPLRSEGRRGNFHNLINGNYAAKKALGVTVCVCVQKLFKLNFPESNCDRSVLLFTLPPSDTVHMFFFLSFQEGRYVKSKDFDGIGLTPYDPYHNSTFVVSGKSKNQEYDYAHKKCSSIGTNGLCTFRTPYLKLYLSVYPKNHAWDQPEDKKT